MVTQNTTTLDAVRDLVEAERGLTEALESAFPLISSSGSLSSAQAAPLPTPKDLNAAKEVLALARSLSSRSSLPPFPNQLRGGALGSMQRKLTKLERLRKDKQRLEEEEQKKQQQNKKKKEEELLLLQKREEKEKQEKEKKRKAGLMDAGHGGRRQHVRVERTFMNLSDSSSEEDESDDEEEDEDSDESD